MITLAALTWDKCSTIYHHSLCQASKDGKYLLLSGVFLTLDSPTSAKYFDHWDNNYKSATSFSIGVNSGISGLISAKFSAGYTSTKLHMYNQDSKMTHSHIRYKAIHC